MAVRFMDSCDNFGSGQHLRRWDGHLSPIGYGMKEWIPFPFCFSADQGRSFGSCINFFGSFNGFVSKALPQSISKYHVVSHNLLVRTWGLSPGQLPDPNDPKFGVAVSARGAIATGQNTTWSVILGNNGQLSAKLKGFGSLTNVGTTVATSALGVIRLDGWAQIEVEFFVDPTVGFLRIYVEGSLVADSGLIDTETTIEDPNEPVGEVIYRQPGVFQGRMDEFYVLDDLGTSNTSRLGRVTVRLVPSSLVDNDFTGAGTTNNPSPSVPPRFGACPSGDKSAKVNDSNFLALALGDSNQVSSNTVGDRVTHSPSSPFGTPIAVQVSGDCRKTSAASTEIKLIGRKASTDHDGSITHQVFTTYKLFSEVFNEDPSDNTSWTSAKFTAIDWGIRKI